MKNILVSFLGKTDEKCINYKIKNGKWNVFKGKKDKGPFLNILENEKIENSIKFNKLIIISEKKRENEIEYINMLNFIKDKCQSLKIEYEEFLFKDKIINVDDIFKTFVNVIKVNLNNKIYLNSTSGTPSIKVATLLLIDSKQGIFSIESLDQENKIIVKDEKYIKNIKNYYPVNKRVFNKPKIIYLHGYNSSNKNMHAKVFKKLKASIQDLIDINILKNLIQLEPYNWDSSTLLKGLKSWNIAKENAQKESLKLLDKIEEYENKQQPYYLIAHSLGTMVVAEAINNYKDNFKFLKNVFFVSSALPENYKFRDNLNVKIINFYSSQKDKVLSKIYPLFEKKDAAGRYGFLDNKNVLNIRTNITHGFLDNIKKNSKINILWDTIFYLITYKESFNLKGKFENLNKDYIYNENIHQVFENEMYFIYKYKSEYFIVNKSENIIIAKSTNLYVLLCKYDISY